jgi:hypothetical protein
MQIASSTAAGADAQTLPTVNPVGVGDANLSRFADHAVVHGDAVKEVFGAIFRGDAAGRLFIVLRNGEGLPERQSGNDVDVTIRPGVSLETVVTFILSRASEVEWVPLCVSRRRRTTGFSIVDARHDSMGTAIHFDVFDGISAFGIPLIPTTLLAAESVVRQNVRQLNARGRSLATVAHHVGYSGALTKDKYVAELAPVLARPADRAWLVENARRMLGVRVANELQVGIGPESQHPLRSKSRVRQLASLWTAARRAPDGTSAVIRGIISYLGAQLPSLVQPPGIVGCRGERIRELPQLTLTDTLASRVAPLAMIADNVRSPASAVRTHNSDKHRRCIADIWSAGVVLRWTVPSLFLWWQAKQGRVVVLRRLPLAVRLLRRVASPGWITVEER